MKRPPPPMSDATRARSIANLRMLAARHLADAAASSDPDVKRDYEEQAELLLRYAQNLSGNTN